MLRLVCLSYKNFVMVKDKKRRFNTFRTIIKLSVKSFKLRFDLYSVI